MKDLNKITEEYQKQLFLFFLEWASQTDLNCSTETLWSEFKDMYLTEEKAVQKLSLSDQNKEETTDFIQAMVNKDITVEIPNFKLPDGQEYFIKINGKQSVDDEKVWHEIRPKESCQVKADVALTLEDQEMNNKIAELAGFKKEEPKPEIDLLKCDERRFRAKIEGIECEGVVSVSSNGSCYLCQDRINGAKADNKKGFKFSWRVYRPFTSKSFRRDAVTDFELLPEPRVIFTNCIGET